MCDVVSCFENINTICTSLRKYIDLKEYIDTVFGFPRVCYACTYPFRVTETEYLSLYFSINLEGDSDDWSLRVYEMYKDGNKMHDSDRFMDIHNDIDSIRQVISDILKDVYVDGKKEYSFPMFNKDARNRTLPSYCKLYDEEDDDVL